MLIKGNELNEVQLRKVLDVFFPYPTLSLKPWDSEWLSARAFSFDGDTLLSDVVYPSELVDEQLR